MNQFMLDYQETDKELRKIELEIRGSEERRKAASAKEFLTTGEDFAKKTDRRSIELLTVYGNLKVEFEKQTAIISEYEAALAGSKEDFDELAYLTKKINQVMQVLKRIESELIAVTKDMEDTSKSFMDFKKKFAATKEEYKMYKQKYDELKASKNAAIAEISGRLAIIAKNIEPELLARYLAKRKEKIFPVLVPLNGSNMCGGCSMELSLNEMGKLKSAGIIECEYCKRLIYITT